MTDKYRIVRETLLTTASGSGILYVEDGQGELSVVRERTVEQHLVKGLEQIGVRCVKFIPDLQRGMPDRIILLPGSRVIWVELKTETGCLSEIQLVRHRELRLADQIVKVVWTIAEADKLIEEIKSTYL